MISSKNKENNANVLNSTNRILSTIGNNNYIQNKKNNSIIFNTVNNYNIYNNSDEFNEKYSSNINDYVFMDKELQSKVLSKKIDNSNYKKTQVDGTPYDIYRPLYSIDNDKLVVESQIKHPRLLKDKVNLVKFPLCKTNFGLYGCCDKYIISDIEHYGTGLTIYFKSLKVYSFVHFLISFLAIIVIVFYMSNSEDLINLKKSLSYNEFYSNHKTNKELDISFNYNIYEIIKSTTLGNTDYSYYSCSTYDISNIKKSKYFLFNLNCGRYNITSLTDFGLHSDIEKYSYNLHTCDNTIQKHVNIYIDNNCDLSYLMYMKVYKECKGLSKCEIIINSTDLIDNCKVNNLDYDNKMTDSINDFSDTINNIITNKTYLDLNSFSINKLISNTLFMSYQCSNEIDEYYFINNNINKESIYFYTILVEAIISILIVASVILILIYQNKNTQMYNNNHHTLASYSVYINNANLKENKINYELNCLIEHIYNVMVRDLNNNYLNEYKPEDPIDYITPNYDFFIYEINYSFMSYKILNILNLKNKATEEYNDCLLKYNYAHRVNSDKSYYNLENKLKFYKGLIYKYQYKLKFISEQNFNVLDVKKRLLKNNEIINDIFITFVSPEIANLFKALYHKNKFTRFLMRICCCNYKLKHLYFKNRWLNIAEETPETNAINWCNIAYNNKKFGNIIRVIISYFIFVAYILFSFLIVYCYKIFKLNYEIVYFNGNSPNCDKNTNDLKRIVVHELYMDIINNNINNININTFYENKVNRILESYYLIYMGFKDEFNSRNNPRSRINNHCFCFNYNSNSTNYINDNNNNNNIYLNITNLFKEFSNEDLEKLNNTDIKILNDYNNNKNKSSLNLEIYNKNDIDYFLNQLSKYILNLIDNKAIEDTNESSNDYENIIKLITIYLDLLFSVELSIDNKNIIRSEVNITEFDYIYDTNINFKSLTNTNISSFNFYNLGNLINIENVSEKNKKYYTFIYSLLKDNKFKNKTINKYLNVCELWNKHYDLYIIFYWLTVIYLIISNLLSEIIIKKLTKFEKNKSYTYDKESNMIKILVLRLINNLFVFLIIFTNIPFFNSNLNSPIFAGIYKDFNSTWFKDMSFTIILIYTATIFGTYFIEIFILIITYLRRCYDNKEKNLIGKGSTTVSKKEFFNIYVGYEFYLDLKYSRILYAILMSLLLGSTMPIFYVINFVYFVFVYWVDKLLCK